MNLLNFSFSRFKIDTERLFYVVELRQLIELLEEIEDRGEKARLYFSNFGFGKI